MRCARSVVIAAAAALAAVTASCSSGGGDGAVTATETVAASPDMQVSAPPLTGGAAPPPAAAGSRDETSKSAAPATPDTPAVSTAPASGASASAPTSPPRPPSVVIEPTLGSIGVAPTAPISVEVADGRISELAMTTPDGGAVDGEFSDGRTRWSATEPLGYGRTYTLSGSATGADGSTVPIKGTLTTLTPDRLVTSTIAPGEGATVGVAFPVMIKFSEGLDATVRARIAKHVRITASPEVEGAWAWVRHDDQRWGLDFRPKQFWPAGAKVHVEADLYGVDMGDGGYGATDLSRDFTIGRNQVVYANAKAHEIVVKRDGKAVATYPASFGNGDLIGDPNRVTRSGIHVVSAKHPVYKMSNPAYGYTNITEYWDVRISSNGEFIHQNMESFAAQGHRNVSHGCINLSDVSAKAYYQSAMIGDPVIISGTSIQLSQADGDIYDWAVPWAKWKTGTASE